MNLLKENIDRLYKIRNAVKNKDKLYFDHTSINEKVISKNTISIIMTSNERSLQVYYTLQTIANSKIKDIHIVLVDDSIDDPVKIDKLKEFDLYIDLVTIKLENKVWRNPCINYNIGFQYIKGDKIIIQNSEVCHIGDILNWVQNNTIDNVYYSFDVRPSRNFEINQYIYSKENLDISIFKEDIYSSDFNGWYQHSIIRNCNYHFLIALTRNTFDKIKEFSYDYAFAIAFDDDDFIFKIKKNNIIIQNVESEQTNIGGIHLYHNRTAKNTLLDPYQGVTNYELLSKKKKYFEEYGEYLELSSYNIEDVYHKYNIIYNI